MTTTIRTAPVELQLDEGPGIRMGGGSDEKPTTVPLAGLPAALPWAARYIRAGGPDVPDYGSPAWEQLDDRDPRKVAACVLAAEVHRTYWSPKEHARRLRAELDALREYEEPAVWSPQIVAEVHRTANRPTYAELCDRRGEPERAARAREHEARMREVA